MRQVGAVCITNLVDQLQAAFDVTAAANLSFGDHEGILFPGGGDGYETLMILSSVSRSVLDIQWNIAGAELDAAAADVDNGAAGIRAEIFSQTLVSRPVILDEPFADIGKADGLIVHFEGMIGVAGEVVNTTGRHFPQKGTVAFYQAGRCQVLYGCPVGSGHGGYLVIDEEIPGFIRMDLSHPHHRCNDLGICIETWDDSLKSGIVIGVFGDGADEGGGCLEIVVAGGEVDAMGLIQVGC